MSLEAFYHTLTTSASVWGSPRYTATTEAAGAGAAARDSGVYINLNFSARDKAGLFSFLPIPDAYLSDATCSKISQIYRGCAPTDSKRGHELYTAMHVACAKDPLLDAHHFDESTWYRVIHPIMREGREKVVNNLLSHAFPEALDSEPLM